MGKNSPLALKRKLLESADKRKAKSLSAYFKTGKGEYGQGDIFLGISVPDQRKIATAHKGIPLESLGRFLESKIHEFRFTALEILGAKYESAARTRNGKEKAGIVKYYLRNLDSVNNWDLVDASAPQILGDFLLDKNKDILFRLARSENFWHRRIAAVSTLAFIRRGKNKDALAVIEILLKTKQHDLVNKAMGWMLREIGNRSISAELKFLRKHFKRLPRITFRYACERLPKTAVAFAQK